MTIHELIARVREHLRGIDQLQEDDGYWFTPDGAKAGRIILRNLEQMLRDNWPDHAPAPASATPEPPIPPGLIPIRYDAGAWVTIERTSLPPRPESWAVRAGEDCLTTDGNWVHEEQPSERPEGWHALHRFPTLQAAWEALQRSRGVQA
ncbi:MAG: hypothetical protein VKO39_03375 [Cyanobacteriota bacterium]|nr:hypothetical protein [Cyanobacteriota bacterium]